jgi:energy-coupling factor transport system permease protein
VNAAYDIAAGGPRDRTDARAVLAYLGAVMLVAFSIQHPLYLALLTASVWLVLAGLVPRRVYAPYLTYGAVAAIGVMLINPLVSRAGASVLWTGPTLPLIGPFTISAEAIVFGVGMGLRLLCVVALFALHSSVVDPDALYRLIAPLSEGTALVVAMSVRLFPATARDAGRIMDAQRARGLRLDSGSWATRVRATGPVMDALLMTSLERAMGLAEALEARGYGRPGRTRLPGVDFGPGDRLVTALAAAALVAGLAVALGPGRFAYYPVLPDPARPLDLALAVALALLVAFPLAIEWRRAR